MSDEIKIIRLRAHHLLCIQGFQGHGYSTDFIENMDQIFNRIKNEPDTILEILTECDDICNHCPYNRLGYCSKEPDSAVKVRIMDRHVLERTGIADKDTGTVSEIFERVNTRFKNIKDVKSLCGDCEWKTKCSFYLSLNE